VLERGFEFNLEHCANCGGELKMGAWQTGASVPDP
jgi:recombinational DNA repair protein (RecF pathway)